MNTKWVARSLVVFGMLVLTGPAARAMDPAPNTAIMTAVIREQLIKHMPTPLIQTKNEWNKQREVVTGWDIRRQGFGRWETKPRKAVRNDGHWYRATVIIPDPQQTLHVELRNVRSGADGELLFNGIVAANTDLKFEQQVWKSGTRLYSGETRGRCRSVVELHCIATNRFEKVEGSVLPTAVLRLRVTQANLSYDQLVIEHTLGVGGDAARILGETGHKLLTRMKPSLERSLLDRANEAIVKAGDTKEVRVEFEKLFSATPKK